jgi:tetratricopeptide (TPR) repeat protein
MGGKISAVLIAKNEGALIGRCLKSLAGLDETVVLDTGSSDKTVKIAKEVGAKVVEMKDVPVPFHFAQARNAARALASNDWIFTIDADEVLRPGCIRKMRKAVDEAGDTSAFVVTFIDQANKKATHTTVIKKIKLFKNSEWDWKYRVHEQLFAKDPAKRKIGDLGIVSVDHLPAADKTVRHSQNIELLKLCIQENPEFTRAFRHLGQELMLEKKFSEAIPYLAEYAEKTEEGPIDKSQGLMMIGDSYVGMGKVDEALKWFDIAGAADPRRREPYHHASWALIKACRLDEALVYIRKMLSIPVTVKPGSSVDLADAWGGEPIKMLTFCTSEIARAKAEFQAKNA